jgi:hypothetical protein
MSISKNTFEGGMNTDLDESMLQSNMYRYALNVRNGNSERGAVGTISNAEGNTLIDVTLPSGGNKVIGAYDDEANDRVIYIVFNVGGDNRIFLYDYKNNVVKTVVADSGNTLNLTADNVITGINTIVGNGTSYLLFTDNFGEPKNIDIDAGVRSYDHNLSGSSYIYRKFLGDYDTVSPAVINLNDVYSRDISYSGSVIKFYYRATVLTTQDPTVSSAQAVPQSDWEMCPAGYIYGNLSEESFTAIVTAPEKNPTVRYVAASQSFNYLYGNLYQFKYCYVRADGRESAWSPVSTFLDPKQISDGLLNITTFENINSYNNRILVYGLLPDFSIYKSIKFAVRRSMNDSSPDDWQLAKEIGLTEDLGLLYAGADNTLRLDYDGSVALLPLDTDRATQLMSWIPKKARAQAVTSRNRVVYANFTEGMPYNLNTEYSLNQNPPVVKFFEKNNPYQGISALSIYEYDGAAISASTVTVENKYDFSGVSGFGIKFPSSITIGSLYTLEGAMNFRIIAAGEVLVPSTPLQFSVSVVATSTSTSTLVNSFVNTLNANESTNIANLFATNIDYQTVSASNVFSGASRYLLIEPAASAAIATPQYYLASGSIESYLMYIPKLTVGATSSINPVKTFKRGTIQTFGIAYSDEYGRLSTVLEHSNFSVSNPWWRDSQYSTVTASGIAGNVFSAIGARYASMELYHDAPSWATKYHIVKTNSNGMLNSIAFPLALAGTDTLPKLSDGNDNPLETRVFYRGYVKTPTLSGNSAQTVSAASLGGEELIYISLASLQGSTFAYTSRNSAPIQYDYTSGDRIRFCFPTVNSTGGAAPTITSQYFDGNVEAEIVDYSSDYNAVAIRVNDLPSDFTGSGDLFAANNSAAANNKEVLGLVCEIYSPQKQKQVEFYYEIYTGAISADTANGRYYHVGTSQTQNSAQSAKIEIYNGDAFLKPRTYIIRAAGATLAAASAKTIFVEDFNYFDKVPSRTWGAGRPNRAVRSTSLQEDITGFLGEVERPITMRYSEPFLPDQGYNGLGTINDLNFKDANGALKSIQHLHTEGSRMIILHENAVGFAESDRSVITTLDNNNMTVAANTPISDVIYYSDRAGIGLNPESFAFNNSRKYFVDVDQGQVCRLSQDGITPISNGMDKYFKTVFRSMITSPYNSYAFGTYDKRTDEYTLSLQSNETISGQSFTAGQVTTEDLGVTVVFDVGDTTPYNLYIGQFVRFYYPDYDTGGVIRKGFDEEVAVTAFDATTVTVAIPPASKTAVSQILNLAIVLTFYINLVKIETLTYSERLKAWTSFHSFKPDNLCSAGLDLVSFRAGKLWIHNDYDNPMRYYNVDYDAYIDVIDNTSPDQIKIWKTTALKVTTEDAEVTATDFLVPISSADTTAAVEAVSGGVEDSRGKVSTCTTPVYKEGQIYFDYMRTGSGTSYINFIEGDKVRGYWVRTRFKINSGISKIYKIIAVTFDSIKSNYTR